MWNPSSYQAVIFDLDDTLYPEQEYVFSGFDAVSDWASHHLSIPKKLAFEELKQIFQSGNRSHTFNQWLTERQLNTDNLVQTFVRVYREHSPTIRPFQEIPELLTALGRQCQVALLTDGDATIQKRKLAALKLGSAFKVVTCTDEWGKEAWKPNSQCFRLTLDRLGVDAQKTIYVGDNPRKDFLGAKKLGIYTIRLRVPNGLYCSAEPADSSYAPDVEVKSLNELSQLLLPSR
jgi:putative hydrolase of the HAD superfamily